MLGLTPGGAGLSRDVCFAKERVASPAAGLRERGKLLLGVGLGKEVFLCDVVVNTGEFCDELPCVILGRDVASDKKGFLLLGTASVCPPTGTDLLSDTDGLPLSAKTLPVPS